MKKIHYSPDVDALMIELGNEAIAYAEIEDNVILHFSNDDKLVLIEVLDYKKSVSQEMLQAMISMS